MHKKYQYLILAGIFFLIWKIFLVNVLWSGRISPPESDDSFVYVANIESVRRCQTLLFCNDTLYPLTSSLGFDRLVYRFNLGAFAKIFNLKSVDVYHISFYIGYLFLLPSLYLLLKSLNHSTALTIVSIIALALYHGQGSYHGFYWVVPSFFSLALLFYLLSATISGKKSWKFALLLIPIGIYTHLLFFYSVISLLPSYFIFDWIFNKKVDRGLLKRILISVLICLSCYLPTEIYLNNRNSEYSYGLINQVNTQSVSVSPLFQQSSVSETKPLFPGFDIVWESYFKFLTLHWIISIGFLFCLFILWHYKKYKLLSLYFSALTFTLVSTLSTYGSRGLIVIWPITYVVVAQGWWLAYQYVAANKGIYYKAVKIFLGLAALTAIFSNMMYAYYSNTQKNMDNSWDVDPGLERYILENIRKETPVYFTGKILESYFGSNSLYKHLNRISDPLQSCVNFVSHKGKSNFSSSQLNKSFTAAAKIFGYKREALNENVELPKIPDGFVFEKNFGSISIYLSSKCVNR